MKTKTFTKRLVLNKATVGICDGDGDELRGTSGVRWAFGGVRRVATQALVPSGDTLELRGASCSSLSGAAEHEYRAASQTHWPLPLRSLTVSAPPNPVPARE